MTDDSGRTLWRPVTCAQVEAQAEDLLALWKTQHAYTQRLKYQDAHPSLIEQMEAVSGDMKSTYDRLVYLRDYFPDDETLET